MRKQLEGAGSELGRFSRGWRGGGALAPPSFVSTDEQKRANRSMRIFFPSAIELHKVVSMGYF
jgi:hypothetical protein